MIFNSEAFLSVTSFDSMTFAQQLEPSQSGYIAPPHPQQTSHQTSEAPDVAHLYENPCLNDLDSNYAFEVQVPMEEKEKKLWYYEPSAKLLFVKVGQPLTAIISYKRKPQEGNLFVRLMPIYTALSDCRLPVNRCQNHKQSCKTAVKEHLVHCYGHENACYVGKEEGENFKDRLAIVVPLKKACAGMQETVVKEEICFSFGCLNSCSSGINRRPTALIFTLENV